MASFHTPGHKNRFLKSFNNLFELDLTELDATDDLYNPKGPIVEAEQLAASYFGAKKVLFSTSGNTLCIQAMLRLAVPSKSKIICARNLHKSALGAIILLDLEPIWVFPEVQEEERGLPGRITSKSVEMHLKKNPNARAVYITSPDYYGCMCDVEKISSHCKKNNTPLLVDNAHGTHLACLDPSLHPIALGADISSDSAHKTLPVLTSGAFLNINNDNYLEDATGSMALFGSTSPSFPILASLDLCRDWMQKNGRAEFSRLERKVRYIENLATQKGISLPPGRTDPTRISLGVGSIGISPGECAKIFRKFAVEPEFASDFYLILIPSPFNTDENFENLERAILSLEKKEQKKEISLDIPKEFDARQILSPREAFFAENKKVSVECSVGKIASRGICPCPPGFLFVAPGEEITEESAFFMKKTGILDILVVK